MTTIATDGKSMACDSRLIGSHIDQINTKKIFRVRGKIVGIAGALAEALIFVDWLKSETKDTKPDLSDSFEAIVVGPNGVDWYGDRLVAVSVGIPAAIGSGGDYAMGAMMAGATPKKAVEIAKKLDPGSGGPVKELILK
ncbi:MAG: hypothetical protein KAS66_05375 [Candidatus Omnitrophica bacterium]|nr:hypothetical protein [Candidatus Omnitrophota bacterium]